MPIILLTNDDGIADPGLLALKRAMETLPDVEILVVAPEQNRSASGHSITMHDPLRIRPGMMADGSQGFACSGTPADCVRLALAGTVNDIIPQLVVSGINSGYNMGVDIHYSGTAACAREAAINGVPAIATSTTFRSSVENIEEVYRMVAGVGRQLAEYILADGLPPNLFLNLNAPGLTSEQVKGIRITSVGGRSYSLQSNRREDPMGYSYYWPYSSGNPVDVYDPNTDVGAVADGYVSVTPITLDSTDHTFLNSGYLGQLTSWEIA